MNNEIKMSVSSLTRKDNDKAVYVLFQDRNKTAEFALPGCRLINNYGFNEVELSQLKEYVDNEQDKIYSLAKQVNPMKAFMGEKKEK